MQQKRNKQRKWATAKKKRNELTFEARPPFVLCEVERADRSPFARLSVHTVCVLQASFCRTYNQSDALQRPKMAGAPVWGRRQQKANHRFCISASEVPEEAWRSVSGLLPFYKTVENRHHRQLCCEPLLLSRKVSPAHPVCLCVCVCVWDGWVGLCAHISGRKVFHLSFDPLSA